MAQTNFSQIAGCFTSFLVESGVHAVDAWEKGKHHEHCVVVVSLKHCTIDSAGLGDYLGVMDQGGFDTEIYGKRCSVTLGLDLYAPSKGGAGLIAQELEQLLQVFSQKDGCQLRLREFSAGAIGFDKDSGRLRREVELKSQVYLYYVEGSDEPLLEFDIKGVLKNGNSSNA